jgi:hypothetical protein
MDVAHFLRQKRKNEQRPKKIFWARLSSEARNSEKQVLRGDFC